MKRNPKPSTRAAAFAVGYVPPTEPLFELGREYTLVDGAKVTVKRIEWLANKWCYFLNKLTPSAILRSVSAITQPEFIDLTTAKAQVAA